MRKIIAAVAAFALLTGLLTGCSGGGDNGAGGTTASVTSSASNTTYGVVTVDEDGSDAETADTEAVDTEEAPDPSDEEMLGKIEEISGIVTGKLSKVILNRLYDSSSSMSLSVMFGTVGINVRVKEPAHIPDAAFEICDVFMDALEEVGLAEGHISVVAYDTNDQDRMIDESLVAWRSDDGIIGTLNDAPQNAKIEDCTVNMLYDYFGDDVKPFDQEETSDIIKLTLQRKAYGLLHEDENSVLVSMAGGSIAVMVRTYEEFLIPAAAEYAAEIALSVSERSELPFSRVNVTVYDNDEKGGIVQESMVGWTTLDGETGEFNSKVEGISGEQYTLSNLYEKYSEYSELIEKAKKGDRLDLE